MKIFIFCNSCAPQWHHATSLSEDGVFLAGHICSDHLYIPHDMGMTSNWKHETYNKYAPEGWELVLTEPMSPEVTEAYKKHKSYTKEEYEKKYSVLKDLDENPKIQLEVSE